MSSDRDLEITIATKQFAETLQRMERALPHKLHQGFESFGRAALYKFVTQRLSGGVRGVKPRTGNLRRSFSFRVAGSALANMTLSFYSTAPYAMSLEFGATIKPVRAGALAIPFDDGKWRPTLTAAGVHRLGAGRLRDALPAYFPDWNFWAGKSREGNSFIFGSHPNYTEQDPKHPDRQRRKAMPFYHLKQKVVIPPQLGFVQSLEDSFTALHERLAQGAQGVFDGR